jgi:hypothetical protein
MSGFHFIKESFGLITLNYQKSLFIFISILGISYFGDIKNIYFEQGSILGMIADFIYAFVIVTTFYIFFTIIAYNDDLINRSFKVAFNFRIYVNLLFIMILLLICFLIGVKVIPNEVFNDGHFQYLIQKVVAAPEATINVNNFTSFLSSLVAEDERVRDYLKIFDNKEIINGIYTALSVFISLYFVILAIFVFTFPYFGIIEDPKLIRSYWTSILIQFKNIFPLFFLGILYFVFMYFLENVSRVLPILSFTISGFIKLFTIYLVYNIFINTIQINEYKNNIDSE